MIDLSRKGENKVKVGDKVRVKSLDDILKIEGVEDYECVENPGITDLMFDCFGNEGWIKTDYKDGQYVVFINKDTWVFREEWLELVSTARVEEIKNPTYDDLKPLFIKTNSDRHRDLVNQIHDVYVDKNMKYGDAFAETIEKYGMIAALTRMNDKFNRIEQFIVNGFDDSEESLKDSLLDLANYCLMTVMEIDKK